MSGAIVGTWRRFNYPRAFTSLPEYTARRGSRVFVVRKCRPDEADGPAQGCEQMYAIRAADGWAGKAWRSELGAKMRAPKVRR